MYHDCADIRSDRETTATKLGWIASATTAFGVSTSPAFADSETLKAVQDRGTLLCSGHNGSYFGFVEVNDKNEWKGLDIDFCRALTVMILGDKDANQFVPLSWALRFPALQSGDGDVVIKATVRRMGRDTELCLQFSNPYFFGGTQIMVRKDPGATTATDLDGGTVCVAVGTTIERIVADHMKSEDVEHTMISFEKTAEVIGAYKAGRCDA